MQYFYLNTIKKSAFYRDRAARVAVADSSQPGERRAPPQVQEQKPSTDGASSGRHSSEEELLDSCRCDIELEELVNEYRSRNEGGQRLQLNEMAQEVNERLIGQMILRPATEFAEMSSSGLPSPYSSGAQATRAPKNALSKAASAKALANGSTGSVPKRDGQKAGIGPY